MQRGWTLTVTPGLSRGNLYTDNAPIRFIEGLSYGALILTRSHLYYLR